MDLTNNQPLSTAEIQQVQAITNSGQLYYDYNDLIERARNYAYLCCRHRTTKPAAFRQLLRLPESVTITPGFICEFGFNLTIGEGTQIGANCKVIDCNYVTIGPHCVLGANVGLYTSNHAFDATKRAQHYCFELPVTIGANCTIGANSVLVPGASVPENTTIMPGSVVVGKLPQPGTYAGAPAQLVE